MPNPRMTYYLKQYKRKNKEKKFRSKNEYSRTCYESARNMGIYVHRRTTDNIEDVDK